MRRFSMLTALLVAVAATPAAAQVSFGPQVSWADDFDLGVGARVTVPFAQFTDAEGHMANMRLIGSFDYFFPEFDELTYFEINANAAYDIETESLAPYVGAGLNVARISWDVPDVPGFGGLGASGTEIGLNVLGGLNFPLGGIDAFGEARFELGGGEQLVLTFGALFGGS